MTSPVAHDLFVLTVGSHIQAAVKTLLTHRRQSLGISNLSFEVQRHPRKDPGCRTEAAEYLREMQGEYDKAMVLFDFQGCGAANTTVLEIEDSIEQQLEISGWESHSIAVIVIEPELEAWLFGPSLPRLGQVMGWPHSQEMRQWLEENGYLPAGSVKPTQPKEAVEAALRTLKRPLTGELHQEMARRQGLARCRDRAFQKFRATLQHWFPVS